MSRTKVKTMGEVVQHVMTETLEQASIRPNAGSKPPPSSPRPVVNPCQTDWQRKWINLSVTHLKVQDAANEAQRFCSRFIHNNTLKSVLVLCGPNGCGKTHIARSIFRYCSLAQRKAYETRKWNDYPNSLFLRWPAVMDCIRARNYLVVEDAMNQSLVVLDDIGADADQWDDGKDKLCQILGRREKMFTVITTNILPQFWSEKFEPRIEDRLLRNSIVKDMTGVTSYAIVERMRA